MTMSEHLLIDSDVLIDYLRGRAEAVSYIEGLTNPPADFGDDDGRTVFGCA